jgi:hypothetical protein
MGIALLGRLPVGAGRLHLVFRHQAAVGIDVPQYVEGLGVPGFRGRPQPVSALLPSTATQGQYDRVIHLLDDSPVNRALAHHYLDVYEYPIGRIHIRANRAALTYRQYDRLSDIDQGAIVDNKRLGSVLQIVQQMQLERDNRRISGSLSRTNQGEPVTPKMRASSTRKQCELSQVGLNAIILRTAAVRAAAVGK